MLLRQGFDSFHIVVQAAVPNARQRISLLLTRAECHANATTCRQ